MSEGICPIYPSLPPPTDCVCRPDGELRSSRSSVRREPTSHPTTPSTAQGEALLRGLQLPAATARPSRGTLLKQLTYSYGKAAAKELVKDTTEGASQCVVSLYSLLDGLASIGKATIAGRCVAEQRAYIAGLVETLVPGLENPSLSPQQARQQALGRSERSQTLEEIFAYRVGTNSTQFAHLNKRLALFEQGSADAAKLLRALPASERDKLAHLLEGELQRADPRYLDWPDRKAALKELFLLRARPSC